MKKKKVLAIAMAVVVTAALSACGMAKSGETDTTKSAGGFPGTPDQDMVTLNVVSEPTELNSMRVSDSISICVLSHCMSGLIRLDENDVPVADLAESWDISDDGTVYTMNLKKDANWSNGEPVTANDYYYSWVTQMKPDTGSIFASYIYKNVKNGEEFYNGKVDESQLGLKVEDDYTLKIEWSHPITEANALFYLSQPFFLPVNQKAYENIGDEQYAKDAEKIVTNGAYTMTEWVHDDHITLEKSEDYYDADAIGIPKVKLTMIGDANTAVNAFTAGEIDLCSLYSEQIDQIEKISKDAVLSYVDGGSWYIDFNTRDENISNVNLRKALAHSIDVQSLLDNVINDGSIAADGMVPGVIAGADGKSYAEVRGSLFAYDKDAASKYLDMALEELGKTKEELKLTFSASDTTYNQNQAAYLQQQWKENLGLDVVLESMPVNTLIENRNGGNYSFEVGGWGPSENDAITFLEIFTTDNMNNNGKYSNAEYDSLITASMEESDPAKRQEILIQAEQILMDDMVVGPLYFTCTTYAVSDKIEGIARTPFQYLNVRNAKFVSE
ncbi:ABC transporter substrate-binding protein [uncultured Robinsoniella sp.]|uniref:peptide ABC transporter substrate-binding protein n=1 Tax=uncultured Robinsoniella sp. TaxID=904190 RepID=UPI00374F7C56